MDGDELTGKTGSAAAEIALAAVALTLVVGRARVSTGPVQKSSDRLSRPKLILVYDHQVTSHRAACPS